MDRPAAEATPFELLGGETRVRAIVTAFYDAMDRDEPALARLHPCDAHGHVALENRERFAQFFIGWLGGPQDYMARHGHPRLRMRHARVAVDTTMRDAWLRCMQTALDANEVHGDLRAFLNVRLGEVANFLRNVPE